MRRRGDKERGRRRDEGRRDEIRITVRQFLHGLTDRRMRGREEGEKNFGFRISNFRPDLPDFVPIVPIAIGSHRDGSWHF